MTKSHTLRTELPFLALLALLWGASYLFIKIAVAEIPPLTLIALRVSGAACFLIMVMGMRGLKLPRDSHTWRKLLIQSFLNSIGAWTVLAWGQQFVDAGLASVLNSTSPVFVFLFITFISKHESVNGRKLAGAILGIIGVTLIVGIDALQGLGSQVAGQIACLIGAALYAGAAIYGKRFNHISAVITATGTMIWASVILIPLALISNSPWELTPSWQAITATLVLSIPCTGVALLIYFRLIKTIGSLGAASQSYLRAGVGVMLGLRFLGESLSLLVALGLTTAITGVILINWPTKTPIHKP